jgi:hypothetical protein
MKRIALFAAVGCLLAAGCSSTPAEPDAASDPAAPAEVSTEAAPAEVPTEAAPAEVPTEAAPTADAAALVIVKVSANNATEEELIAAFEAAGIANAAKWADEVIEYRPYPDDDPNWTHLREELAKYNPEAGVIDQIIANLEP